MKLKISLLSVLTLLLFITVIAAQKPTTTTVLTSGSSGAAILGQANADQFTTDATGKLVIKDSALTTNSIVKSSQTLSGTSTFLQMIATGGSSGYQYFDLYNGASTLLLRRKSDNGVSVLETPIGFSSSGLAIGSALLADSGLTVGGGPLAIKVLSAAAELDFPSIVANSTTNLTITVTGAGTNSVVLLGLPAAFTEGLSATAYVSSTNTVTVRVTNPTVSDINPATGSFRATVIVY